MTTEPAMGWECRNRQAQKDGSVPSAAVAIAEAVPVPVYAKEQIASERPLKAGLTNAVRHVTGSVKCDGPPGYTCPGSEAAVKISKKSGQIRFMTHYRDRRELAPPAEKEKAGISELF